MNTIRDLKAITRIKIFAVVIASATRIILVPRKIKVEILLAIPLIITPSIELNKMRLDITKLKSKNPLINLRERITPRYKKQDLQNKIRKNKAMPQDQSRQAQHRKQLKF